MSDPLVSVVLPTRNGGRTLAATLEAVAAQRTDFPFEIVAVDSGSQDDTVTLLHKSAQQVIRIPPEAFNHGLTRNLAIEHARGEFIVLLVQDALPVSSDWLARLIAPLQADQRVAGAFCRQQPRPDATALAQHYLQGWVAASPTPRVVRLASPGEFERLEPDSRLRLCAFDNVCSCIRRSVWQQIPFPNTPIAEDLEWAKSVLLAGHSLHYVPDAVVLHSHDRPARYEFARTYTLHERLSKLFGLRTIPTMRVLMRAIFSTMRLHVECERRARHNGSRRVGMNRAVALAFAWPLGQYLGGLAASRGWKPIRFRSV